MEIWSIAALAIGALIGYAVGRHHVAMLRYWENTKAAADGLKTLLPILMGGGCLGGGIALLAQIQASAGAWYVLGCAIGGAFGEVFPRLPEPRLTGEQIVEIAEAWDRTRSQFGPNIRIENAYTLVAQQLPRPTDLGFDEDSLEERLGQELDAMPDPEDGIDDAES